MQRCGESFPRSAPKARRSTATSARCSFRIGPTTSRSAESRFPNEEGEGREEWGIANTGMTRPNVLSRPCSTRIWPFPCLTVKFLKQYTSLMKQKSPKHRKQTRRIVARKAAHRKVPKAIDLNQLSERLSGLRFNLHKAILDALK